MHLYSDNKCGADDWGKFSAGMEKECHKCLATHSQLWHWHREVLVTCNACYLELHKTCCPYCGENKVSERIRKLCQACKRQFHLTCELECRTVPHAFGICIVCEMSVRIAQADFVVKYRNLMPKHLPTLLNHHIFHFTDFFSLDTLAIPKHMSHQFSLRFRDHMDSTHVTSPLPATPWGLESWSHCSHEQMQFDDAFESQTTSFKEISGVEQDDSMNRTDVQEDDDNLAAEVETKSLSDDVKESLRSSRQGAKIVRLEDLAGFHAHSPVPPRTEFNDFATMQYSPLQHQRTGSPTGEDFSRNAHDADSSISTSSRSSNTRFSPRTNSVGPRVQCWRAPDLRSRVTKHQKGSSLNAQHAIEGQIAYFKQVCLKSLLIPQDFR